MFKFTHHLLLKQFGYISSMSGCYSRAFESIEYNADSISSILIARRVESGVKMYLLVYRTTLSSKYQIIVVPVDTLVDSVSVTCADHSVCVKCKFKSNY